MRRAVRALAIAALLGFHVASHAATAAHARHDYTATLAGDLRTIDVRGCIDESVRQRVHRLVAGPDFGRFVRDLRIDARRVAPPDLRGRVDLPHGARCVDYRVDLGAAAASGRGMRRPAAWFGRDLRTTADLWLLAPPLAGEDTVELTLRLPDGVHASVPWQVIAADRYRIASSPDGAWSAVAAFARGRAHRLEVPGAIVELTILGGEPAPDEARLVAWVHGIALDVAAVHGRFPVPRTQVLLLPMLGQTSVPGPEAPEWARRMPEAVGFGRVVRAGGTAVELQFVQTASLEALRADWTAHHEFAHLLLPFLREPGSWIGEGFAGYYQNVLMARAGRYSEAEAWRRLIAGFERGRGDGHYAESLEAALRGGGENALMRRYWTGAVVALRADVELRRQGDSLDALLGRLAQCCLPSRRAWSTNGLFARLDALAGRNVFVGRHDRWLVARDYPHYDDLLAYLGVIREGFGVRLDDRAPGASMRREIMGPVTSNADAERGEARQNTPASRPKASVAPSVSQRANASSSGSPTITIGGCTSTKG